MEVMIICIYMLILIIIGLVVFAVMQIKLAGIKVKDFMSFIQANQLLDSLYRISRKCDNLNTQEQLVFLMEAEKVFEAFDKIPTLVWEDEYRKYYFEEKEASEQYYWKKFWHKGSDKYYRKYNALNNISFLHTTTSFL